MTDTSDDQVVIEVQKTYGDQEPITVRIEVPDDRADVHARLSPQGRGPRTEAGVSFGESLGNGEADSDLGRTAAVELLIRNGVWMDNHQEIEPYVSWSADGTSAVLRWYHLNTWANTPAADRISPSVAAVLRLACALALNTLGLERLDHDNARLVIRAVERVVLRDHQPGAAR
ncbi:hypothetical protein [Kitasatospora sp. NPDC098663]|uniref:hypothetical protein n=1 Tax=Kitasatospora sp. NPDC098663 TaxID=3364096 RepID=UPI0038283C05